MWAPGEQGEQQAWLAYSFIGFHIPRAGPVPGMNRYLLEKWSNPGSAIRHLCDLGQATVFYVTLGYQIYLFWWWMMYAWCQIHRTCLIIRTVFFSPKGKKNWELCECLWAHVAGMEYTQAHWIKCSIAEQIFNSGPLISSLGLVASLVILNISGSVGWVSGMGFMGAERDGFLELLLLDAVLSQPAESSRKSHYAYGPVSDLWKGDHNPGFPSFERCSLSPALH
jgi:hypothetical protein